LAKVGSATVAAGAAASRITAGRLIGWLTNWQITKADIEVKVNKWPVRAVSYDGIYGRKV
jgi:hypothetical protein